MADVLQEFVVKLGFDVDQTQQNRFTDGMKSINLFMEGLDKTLRSTVSRFFELGTAAATAAVSIATGLGHIAIGMGNMNLEAQRVNTSIENIHALGYAFYSAGGSIGDATTALEEYAQQALKVPHLSEVIKGAFQGVTSDDPTQQIVQVFAEARRQIAASADKEGTTTQLVNQIQGILGLDPNLIRRGLAQQFAPGFETGQAQTKQWMDQLDELGKKGEAFRASWFKITDTFTLLKDRATNDFIGPVQRALGDFEKFMGRHSEAIGKYLDDTGKRFDALFSKVETWWKGLSNEQQDQVAGGVAVGGIAAAAAGGSAALGKVLNLAGIPGGGRIAGLLFLGIALAALKNDYDQWKETEGKGSLIDWGKWEGPIKNATEAIEKFNNLITPMAEKLGIDKAFIPAFEGLLAYLTISFLPGIMGILKTPLLALAYLGVIPFAALATMGITYETNAAAQQDVYKQAESEGWQKQGSDRDPMFYNPQTGERINFTEMQRRQGRKIGPLGPGDDVVPFPTADQTMAPEAASFLEALSGGESSGPDPYHQRNQQGSSAFGKYQIISGTWSDLVKESGGELTDINDPKQQDRAAWFLAQDRYKALTGRSLLGDLQKGDRDLDIAIALNKIWPSLPGGSQMNTTPEMWAKRLAAARARHPGQSSTGVVGWFKDRVGNLGDNPGQQPNDPAALAPKTMPTTSPVPTSASQQPADPATLTPQDAQSPDFKAKLYDIMRKGWNVGRPNFNSSSVSPSQMPQQNTQVSLNSSPNITITGVSDPHAAADHVGRAMRDANSDVIRRLQPVFA